MTKRPPGVQIEDSEWVTIAWVGQHEQCCYCGVQHKIWYRVHNGKLQFKGVNLGRPRKLKKMRIT